MTPQGNRRGPERPPRIFRGCIRPAEAGLRGKSACRCSSRRPPQISGAPHPQSRYISCSSSTPARRWTGSRLAEAPHDEHHAPGVPVQAVLLRAGEGCHYETSLLFRLLTSGKKRKKGQGAQERAEDAGGLTPVKDGNAGPALPGPLNVSHDFWVPL